MHAARTAGLIASGCTKTGVMTFRTRRTKSLYPAVAPSASAGLTGILGILVSADRAARTFDPRINGVTVSYAEELRHILVVGSDGTLAEDVQPLARVNVSCIAGTGIRARRGSSGGGGRMSLDFFVGPRTLAFAREAASRAIHCLDAREAPAGEMDVVIAPGWAGALLHDAIGHCLEADFILRKTSVFSGLIGRRVASEGCTLIDNGKIPGRRGSLNVDDEGQPTQKTVLIENGILTACLTDKLRARLMDIPITGNGRRESYEHAPMPRMTNTYMMQGNEDPEDIIRSVTRGIYIANLGGGQVDIANGRFVSSITEAYLIENGHRTAPVNAANLIGFGADLLSRITMVGSDLKFDDGVGTCGKDGQSIPVGVGNPTLKVEGLSVGYTATRGVWKRVEPILACGPLQENFGRSGVTTDSH